MNTQAFITTSQLERSYSVGRGHTVAHIDPRSHYEGLRNVAEMAIAMYLASREEKISPALDRLTAAVDKLAATKELPPRTGVEL